jgi:hemerythrin-like domain-containing protein
MTVSSRRCDADCDATPRAAQTPKENVMPTRGKDAIALLKEDHEKVRGLLARLEKTTERAGDTREELLAKIAAEIKIHTTIEEEIFYPAYREAVSKREDAKLYQEALEEHHVADTVLMELGESDTGSDVFSAKSKVLKDVVEHHAQEEEKQMFPRARRAMETAELKELGSRMEERKREMQEAGEGWLPKAGKLLSAVASRVSSGRSGRSQASVAARGAAPAKSGTKSGAKKPGTRSRAKTASRGRSGSTAKSAKTRKR